MNTLPLSRKHILETLGRMPAFRGMAVDQLDRLAAGTRQFTVNMNHRLLRKGEAIDALHLVVSGQMRLAIPLPNGAERVVGLVGRGESFGEAFLLLREPCAYDIWANVNSHLLAIDGVAFGRELRSDHHLAERTLILVARREVELLHDLESCAQPSSVQRVACFLMQHRPQVDTLSFDVDLPARKRDIAARLGLAQETFSRALALLTQHGVLAVSGRRIQVRDGAKLSQFSLGGHPLKSTIEPQI